MSEPHDPASDRDERRLREAFAHLRDDEAPRAPSLAELVARASREDAARLPQLVWLRLAIPIAGATLASVAWWISTSAPRPAPPAAAAPLIAVGSLHSPTDALLAPPLPPLARGFSSSLIPLPAPSRAPVTHTHSRTTPARRFSA